MLHTFRLLIRFFSAFQILHEVCSLAAHKKVEEGRHSHTHTRTARELYATCFACCSFIIMLDDMDSAEKNRRRGNNIDPPLQVQSMHACLFLFCSFLALIVISFREVERAPKPRSYIFPNPVMIFQRARQH